MQDAARASFDGPPAARVDAPTEYPRPALITYSPRGEFMRFGRVVPPPIVPRAPEPALGTASEPASTSQEPPSPKIVTFEGMLVRSRPSNA